MFLAKETIQKKRDGASLTDEEIGAFVNGVLDHSVSDSQIAALAMAVWFRGMTLREQISMTLAMRDSGQTLSWEDLPGPVVDKHSTGGVGDLVSMVLGPLVAACGGYVPMISGRGLGHTGGTLDKLESIPGFDTRPDVPRFQRMVKENGVAIVGQTANLAPADLRIYAVRDVTATVGSVPLIVASILSKKLAEGLDALVMDIKFGSGAFMEDAVRARGLAQQISGVSQSAGLPCRALLTDMNQPLAWSAGNALEVLEAIRFLRGESRNERVFEVVLSLAAEMLTLARLSPGPDRARAMATKALESGQAAERFECMVRAQGGPAGLLDNAESILPGAPVVRPVFGEREGFVTTIDTKSIGSAVVVLGGGRRRAEDAVDPAVGLSSIAEMGCQVGGAAETGEPLAVIHARDKLDWERAARMVRAAVTLGPEPVETLPPVLEVVSGENTNAN
ncbi:MAG: thymidine phosphorylase [Lysobacterales bacterium]|jgi:thymidine phosphorylase